PATVSGIPAPAAPAAVGAYAAAPPQGTTTTRQGGSASQQVQVPWTPGVWTEPPADAAPIGVWIPRIDVAAPLQTLGLNPDRTLEVPRDWDVVGWYGGAPRPGEPGASVLAGHVDSRSGPAVFLRLGELRPGDLVHVVYEGGFVAAFVVEALERHPKREFPTERVYGETEAPTIRLITCTGSFDRSAGSYEDNLIVYGSIYASWRYDPDASA
ncbi:MAG: class F sortase, partial [Nitriliruptorales bacterium]